MKTTIYMIRHAESPFIPGQERTRGLSEQGKLASKKITELMTVEPIDVIVSSPYVRAVQTVQGLADLKNLPILEYEELRERAIKGRGPEISEEEFLRRIEKAFEDPEDGPLGGESIKQAQERAVPVIKQLLKIHEGKNIVVGTHGNIMTDIMNHFDSRYGYDFWQSTSKPDVYRLVFEGEQLVEVQRLWS